MTKTILNLCKNCSADFVNEVDKKLDSHFILFARTKVLSLNEKSSYLQSERFYRYSNDSVCPKMTKLIEILCKNCSADLENEVDEKSRLKF